MKAAILTPGRDPQSIIKHLNEIDPGFKPEVWPDVTNPEQVSAALVWKVSEDILNRFTNLKFISSFGAGVDHILEISSIPDSVMITRLVDPGLTANVVKYCLMAVFAYEKSLKDHIQNKETNKWEWKEDKPKPVIGILGMGEIGKEIAIKFLENGYSVNGYSLSPKEIEGIDHFSGLNNLEGFLVSSNLLINVMPLTLETRGFFDKGFFKKCTPGTYFINVGRGQQVVDADLIDAISGGIISGATLDVFNEEPLPPNHPLWEQDRIIITPHIAGLTIPESAATQFYENFSRFKNGQPLLNLVDRRKGY